ncbi:hypothetical protein T552_02101 [Pneumocystis carinii B80]|uniref:Condensin complex subunit 1 n=1 Tax=Pneumocystis carinii (strain B80) TaxID=1408658 RepID=A0A0W4ZH18_PNEC8|nr:hypothetical protein T552_02101 [Pneumocystis carinii B80]KTW27660.1 hypothetical protein T552_02101 [Pneumocystis carinii B80]
MIFDLKEFFTAYLDDPENFLLDDNIEDVSKDVNSAIDNIIDAISVSLEIILEEEYMKSLFAILRTFEHVPSGSSNKFVDLIISSLQQVTESLSRDILENEIDIQDQRKNILEILGFSLYWLVSIIERTTSNVSHSQNFSRGTKSSKFNKKNQKQESLDFNYFFHNSLDVMCKILGLRLSKLWVTIPERDIFVSLFIRSAYLIFENEQLMKISSVKMRVFKLLCIAVKHQGHAFGAQTSLIQGLQYYEHLPEPVAEFLQILSEQYDYPQLLDEILRELSVKEFNSNDNKGPKSISLFLVKLSDMMPRNVLKQMTMIIKFLDSDSYTLRCGIIEVCGNLISGLLQLEQSDDHKGQIDRFFDILEERFLDVNPYCRSKVIQVYLKLCDLNNKFPKRRQIVTDLCVRSLQDKSSNVRKNAIRLLSKLISTHPFSLMHGGQLFKKLWYDRLEAVEKQLDLLKPLVESPGLVKKKSLDDDKILEDFENANLDDEKIIYKESFLGISLENVKDNSDSNISFDNFMKLHFTRRYYCEALKFIESLHTGSVLVNQLLASKNKSEVLEAMEFYVVADAYKLEIAKSGIRKMLHLIWTKSTSDEGKAVQAKLIECYRGLFFDPPDGLNANEAANYIARNMISLTYGATLAELTSLEQLLCVMMREGYISDNVIKKLWSVYGAQKENVLKQQRQGAIIVLGMLGLADSDVIASGLECLLHVGFGNYGKNDLFLARYSCIALQRLKQVNGNSKNSSDYFQARLVDEHIIFSKLGNIILSPTENVEWFSVAEQAINAIYLLAQYPDKICTNLLRSKCKSVFKSFSAKKISLDDDSLSIKSSSLLSQLLFIVGHVALKQIVYIESCENEFKKKKSDNQKVVDFQSHSLKTSSATSSNELDFVVGTIEDDLSEAMNYIREYELLYGNNSLLARFGPLVQEICINSHLYKDSCLQSTAALTLAKMMCVSARFCELNLPLLFNILEKSPDPLIRSNLLIALGDMNVCFNHLINENTEFLYRRLKDNDSSVKKTCLMTLTFLILAGQVKVKGQLGKMARCLEDNDRRIVDFAKMFFTELSTKDNSIYNNFLDIFSSLSNDSESLDEASFKRIIRFLISFIEKEKHAKQLAEKLVVRLSKCDTERKWNDTVFAISLLPHKNDAIHKIITDGYCHDIGIKQPIY